MTKAEYKGHLETIQKLFQAKNSRLASMPAMDGAQIQVFLSEDLLNSFNIKNKSTRRALLECPYCLAVRSKIAENALKQADAHGSFDMRKLARKHASQFIKMLQYVVDFAGAKPAIRILQRKNADGSYLYFFICPFKVKRIKYSFAGCKWLNSQV